MKQFSKKQLNKIALMWSAAQICNCGADSFDDSFDQDMEVVNISHKIGFSLLNGLPLLNTLDEIIEYVKENG